MILIRENQHSGEGGALGATLSTTNFAYTDLGSSPAPRNVKPETNRLNHVAGTVL
jgi:hypothetical protein